MVQTRRTFLQSGAASLTALSALTIAQSSQAAAQVTLGRSNLIASRLGFGVGDGKEGYFQQMGQDQFTQLIRHAYDQGIRYFDFDASPIIAMLGKALKGLDRESYTLVTQLGRPNDEVLPTLIPRYLKDLNTDYIDGILITAISKEDWAHEFVKHREVLSEAKAQGHIKAHGVSVHGLEGLKTLPHEPWVDLALISVNHRGNWMDAPQGMKCTAEQRREYSVPVIHQIHEAKIGVTAMKVFNADGFENAEERKKSLQFIQKLGTVDTLPIKFKSKHELDETIAMMDSL